MTESIRVYLITTEWPSAENPSAVPFLSRHVRLLRESGVEVEVFHFRGKQNPFNYLIAWWRIRHTAFWKKADILHAHWGQSAFLALFSKKKLVITYHGSDLHGIVDQKGKKTLNGRILSTFSRLIARRADCCIAVSNQIAQLLSGKCKNIKIIPIGIDTGLFFPMDKITCRRRLNLDVHAKIVLFISDPNRTEKRFPLARDAVNEFQKLHPDIPVQLQVVYGIDYSSIPYYINSGDALILTSTHEGSPTVVKEALACKVPIVSFNVGDVAERIADIDGCYLCESQTIECLVKGLEVAIEQGPIGNLPATAIKNLDERDNVSEVIEIYKTLLKDNN